MDDKDRNIKENKPSANEANTQNAQEHLHETSSDYAFLQEKIKERPINKKQLMKKSITTASLAVVFGLIACVTFILLEPVIGNWISPAEEEPNVVALPQEEDEILPEDMVKDENELNSAAELPSESIPVNGNIGDAVSKVDISISDYQLLYDKIYALAQDVDKSMVTVTGMKSDTDWFNNTYERKNQTSGVIIADNGKEILVLADQNAVADATQIMVTFYDHTQAQASLKMYDANTKLAILAVDMTMMDQATRDSIVYAKLGNSNSGNTIGDVVIALGSPLGYSDSLCYGMITSIGSSVSTIDVNYKLITTDIYGSSIASGVLVNMKGQVIGIINQSYNSEDLANQVSALGISELRSLIESLSNAQDQPYLGLYITDVTDVAAQTLGVPRGAYITGTVMDSPAMMTGIRKGDVVVAINEAVIDSVNDYAAELRAYKEGDILTITLMRPNADGYQQVDIKVTVNVLK